jgi:hypothetical protein
MILKQGNVTPQYDYKHPEGPNPWLMMLQNEQSQDPLMLSAELPTHAPQDRVPASTAALEAEARMAQPQVLAEQKYDSLMNRLERRTLQGIDEQKKSADELLKFKDALMSNYQSQVDLSPLMALADQWGGGNMAKSYKAPESEMERLQKIMNVQDKYAGVQSKIADDELGLLKTQLSAELGKARQDRLQNKAPTAEQWKVAGFAARMADSNAILSNLEGHGTSRGTQLQMGKFFPSEFMDEDTKKLDQAQRNFINATLRRESGAAISPEEFKNAQMQYFPMPGDSQEVLAQKRQNRERVIGSFQLEGGSAFNQITSANPIVTPAAGKAGGSGKKPTFEEWKASKGL